MKRIAVAGAAVAAIAAAAFAIADLAQGTSTTSLHLVSTIETDAGFAPKHAPLRAGDRIGTGGIVTGDDTGRVGVTCTVMSEDDTLCTSGLRLSRGTLTAATLLTAAPAGASYAAQARWAITGGTGAYDGARGTAVITGVEGSTKADIQITLLP